MKNLKFNFKVRVKNFWFWVGIAGTFLCTLGVEPSTITSWKVLLNCFVDFIKNPFLIGSFVLALAGVFLDPTTKGLSDSDRAMQYHCPIEDEETEEDEEKGVD